MMRMRERLTIACVVLCLPAVALAETPRFYELEGFGHFLDGNPETTAVSEEGAIALPPEVHERFSDAAASFGAATSLGDDVIVSRVDDGQILAIDAAGKTRNIYKAEESMVTGLLGAGDTLYVAVGSPARVYKIGKDGKAASFYTPEANFVWGMAEGPDNSVFLVTGEPGTVVQVSRKGEGKVLFKPEQSHLRSITYDAKLGLFVGGGERGIVYRAADSKTFRALYDTANPEVTALAVREPYVYVAGVTGAATLVNDDGAKKGKSTADVHSQLMRVSMDGAAEVLAGSSDEGLFSLAFDDRHQVLVATGATGRDDPRGRLYSIDPDKKFISMIYQSPSRRITHLVQLPKGGVAAVAAQGARIVQLTSKVAHKGTFMTLPFDAGINSKFGLVQLLGTFPKGTSGGAEVRSGQTSEPDDSWSPWSKAISAPGNKAIDVPNGRYMQMRVTLESGGDVSPAVQRVRLAYLRQNLPPFVREVSALHKGLALLPIPQDEPKAKTVALGEKPDGPADAERRAPVRARQIPDRGALTIKWVADDPNGDELKFELFVRAVSDSHWRLLKGDLENPFFTLQSSQLPDGHYVFKVRATDAPSNPDGLERQDSRESRAILVDNSPPKFDNLKVSTSGKKVTVHGSVEDKVGPLLELSYALDSGEAKPILPEDGLLDGPSEEFTLHLEGLEPGHHTLTVRAVDEADNEGFSEAVFDL